MLLHRLAHLCGAAGALLVALFLWGVTVPPADTFPDSLLGAFHTFFVGVLVAQEGLPVANDPDWMSRAEPGDVLFLSRGHVAWGEWSHVAVVVDAPDDAFWVRPGSRALVDASIHDGMYLAPLEAYASWPRVQVCRASDDPRVRARIAEAALAQRHRMFASVIRDGAPYSNCTGSVIAALRSVGLDPGLTGWRTPDELLRSEVWRR